MGDLLTDMVRLTQALIAFESTAAKPGKRKAILDFCSSILSDLPVEIRRMEHEGVESMLVH